MLSLVAEIQGEAQTGEALKCGVSLSQLRVQRGGIWLDTGPHGRPSPRRWARTEAAHADATAALPVLDVRRVRGPHSTRKTAIHRPSFPGASTQTHGALVLKVKPREESPFP